jgi:hypothetical protein
MFVKPFPDEFFNYFLGFQHFTRPLALIQTGNFFSRMVEISLEEIGDPLG